MIAANETGQRMHRLMAELLPLHRSMTGAGVRQTLRRLASEIPLEIHEVPSGARVFDWIVPQEWVFRDAYVKDETGRRIVDAKKLNLHVLAHSQPVRGVMRFSELRRRLRTRPDMPDAVPYHTAFFRQDWGFSVSHRQLRQMEAAGNRLYEVVIDADHVDGSLTYGECFLRGTSTEEILISTHTCHPSLCNDNLSGIAVATELARRLAATPRRFSYRFLFLPATIGAIAWLWRNRDRLDRVRGGLIVANVGDPGGFTYKKSRRGDGELDRVAAHVLPHGAAPYEIRDFSPVGYDERQFCSPGIDLPMGCFMRTPDAEYPEYHTSADNLDFVTPAALAGTLKTLGAMCDVLEENRAYRNENSACEPQLGRRGLLQGGVSYHEDRQRYEALLWTLNFSDGAHTLLDIAARANMPFGLIREAGQKLHAAGLLTPLPDRGGANTENKHRGADRIHPHANGRSRMAAGDWQPQSSPIEVLA